MTWEDLFLAEKVKKDLVEETVFEMDIEGWTVFTWNLKGRGKA